MKDFKKYIETLITSGLKRRSISANTAYFNADARIGLKQLKANSVTTTITSPPYGNLKDYGTKNEIGYGQLINKEYFPEISLALKELLRVTVNGGALWLILDTFRHKGKTIHLPYELTKEAQSVGWHFQDMIVWDKGRSLPWPHLGKLRNISEYILLFSKGNKLKNFDIDKLRTTSELSTYWVKYPERFHPDGKSATDIWHIPIPPQGSWAPAERPKHFCPFPIELVNRLIILTTQKDDLVLDPFCGTGSVLVSAGSLGRNAIGFDINRQYYESYRKHGKKTLEKEATGLIKNTHSYPKLRHAIIGLRINKYATTMFKEISKLEIKDVQISQNIYGLIVVSPYIPKKPESVSLSRFQLIIVSSSKYVKRLLSVSDQCSRIPPLSRYGLDVKISVFSRTQAIRELERKSLACNAYYLYENLHFNMCTGKCSLDELLCDLKSNSLKNNRLPIVYSPLKLNINPEK
ncbi:MAG: site-specific DNA-methyltransferase [Candidatus Dadabacteria bacterium]|nr:site-specific DNA-methyltransferase [Candidatus Dadabacteria bacterium]